MIKIAFYKAWKGNWKDKLISIFTLSRFSHVEIVIGDSSYSSSMRDGGVRKKDIIFDDKWIIVDTDINNVVAVDKFYLKTKHCKYDFVGAFMTQILRKKVSYDISKWFCSEWVITALNATGHVKLKNYTSIKKLYKILRIQNEWD